MNKKILVIQARTGEYEGHEQRCLRVSFPKYFPHMRFVNVIKNPNKIKNINLENYSCAIIGGSGEIDISQINNQPKAKTTIPILVQFAKLCIDKDFPLFGICLGHQIIAHSLGSRILLSNKEVGSKEIQLTKEGQNNDLFEKLPKNPIVYQAHKDNVETLPKGAKLLATGKVCKIQAFKVGQNVYGTQFHAEMDKALYIERHELYAKLNPETGYSEKLSKIKAGTKESKDGIRILSRFLEKYAK